MIPRASSLRSSPLSAPSRRGALRILGAAFVVAMLAGAGGCAPTIRAERVVSYPLEAKTRYAWVTDEPVLIKIGDPQPNVRTPANEKLLREAIDRELAARGLSLVAPDEAELLVAFSVDTTTRYRLEGGDPNQSVSGLEAGSKQTKGTLEIYLFDRLTTHQVWRGLTSKWLSKSEEPADVANEAVATVMAAYPDAQ